MNYAQPLTTTEPFSVICLMWCLRIDDMNVFMLWETAVSWEQTHSPYIFSATAASLANEDDLCIQTPDLIILCTAYFMLRQVTLQIRRSSVSVCPIIRLWAPPVCSVTLISKSWPNLSFHFPQTCSILISSLCICLRMITKLTSQSRDANDGGQAWSGDW